MKKQILLFLMMLLPVVASADDSGTCGSNVTYSFNEVSHTLTISGNGAIWDYDIESSNQPWVNYRDEILYVIIESGVTYIGQYSFDDCKAIISVEIPNSVTSIGDYAFNVCSGLTSVHISDLEAWCSISFGGYSSNPLYYAHHLFLNGTEIKDLVIPNNVTSIGNYAFSRCSDLTSVTIPNSVTSIGSCAFLDCSGLTSMTIPNSVTSIGMHSFAYCSGLTSVTIPNSVTLIAKYLQCLNLSDYSQQRNFH